MVDELKAYACLEPYENTGAVIFARSNIEARRLSANEFHDGELGGMSVKRAPWADKFGARHKIPISVMVDHGWHFECCWSGVTIIDYLYYEPREVYNDEKKDWEEDTFLIGKEPVGTQESLVFACQEYADCYYEERRKREKYEKEQLEFYKAYVLSKLPDAQLVEEDGYQLKSHISSDHNYLTPDFRVVTHVHIPFRFPGMKHWAAMELRREYSHIHTVGPLKPNFTCANGDYEAFLIWVEEQKEKRKNG